MRRFFSAYAGVFFRWTSSISRHQEAVADALAGHVAGRETLGRALMKVTGGSAAFNVYWTNVLRPILDAGYLPPVAAGYAEFVARPDIEAAMRSAQQDELRNTSARPYDSHPPLAERLAVLGSRGHESVEPGPPAKVDLPIGNASVAPGWLAFCERVGLGDVDLGALADAA